MYKQSEPYDLKRVPFTRDYYVDPEGCVWSSKNASEFFPFKRMRATLNKRLGRYQIRFYTRDGKWRTYLHIAVALARIGIPDGYERGSDSWQVHHVDENRTNNHPDNLRWLTRAEHDALHYDS